MALQILPCPDASAGAADHTRRWCVAFPDRARLAGLTRPEAERALPWLARLEPRRRDDALVAIQLPVILSDGAGPYLIDAWGRIVLAVGDHPRLAGARVAMGPPGAIRPIGLLRSVPQDGQGGWLWVARAEVQQERTIPALDALDAVEGVAEADAWAATWGRAGAAGGGWVA